MYKITVNIPVYQFKCIVIIDEKIEEKINYYIKKNKWDLDLIPSGQEMNGLAINPGDVRTYYIFYSLHSLTPNYIIHEVSHLVDYVIEDKDLERVGEGRAYLNGYINEKIFDFLIKEHLLINKHLNYKQKPEQLPV